MSRHSLQGARDGRPWTDCGDGPSLTSGRFGDLGKAIGHAGGSPFCVNAVCHFPGPCQPVTVACFTDGADEGWPNLLRFDAPRARARKAAYRSSPPEVTRNSRRIPAVAAHHADARVRV